MRVVGFILFLNLMLFSATLERGGVSILSTSKENVTIKNGQQIPKDSLIIADLNSVISSKMVNIFIKKDSKIQINSSKNSLIIEISTGEIVVNSRGNGSVLFKDGLIEVYGTVKVSKRDSSKTTLSVLNGFSRVTDKSGEKGEMFSRGYSIDILKNDTVNSGRYFFNNDISDFCNSLNCNEKDLFLCTSCSESKGNDIEINIGFPTSYLIVNRFSFLTDNSPFEPRDLQEVILKDSAVQSEFTIFTPQNYGYNIAREFESEKKKYIVLDGVIKEDMNSKSRFICTLSLFSSGSPKQVISKVIPFQSSTFGSGEVVAKDLQIEISKFIMENQFGD